LLGWNDVEKSCLQCGHIVYSRNPLLGQGRLDLGIETGDKTVRHSPDRGRERGGELE
jgi:hypothetical protein